MTEFGKLTAQVNTLNAAMERSVMIQGAVNPAGYARMAQAVKVNSQVTRNAALSTGMFEVQQLRLNSATENYTELMEKQKLTFGKMMRERHKLSKAAYREQLALQQMVVQQMPGTVGGKKVLDIYIPNEVHKDFDTLGNRIGWIREELRSASTQMVNWGKNTQWAGRQMMVGFTMPVLAFGAASAAMTYQVDKQITRIQKVYDTTAQSISGDVNSMIAVEEELMRVREGAMNTARIAARQYGASVTDTLEVQAELAATGKKGLDLQESTNQVMRIATLGEFDRADALKTVIALQSIMGYSAQETGEQLNYMNSIENATSLATQDFAKAIPIALGPLKEMGGDVQDLAMMLVAMKERGIEAGEGANAIKAMMQRLYRPSKQIREEWEKFTGTNILDIRDKNKGNIMGMLEDIADATEGLQRQELVPAIGGLIGTYQVGRINAVLNGLRNLRDGVGQTTSVMEVNSKTATEHANTASDELQRWQQSVSGRFQIALQGIKVELAEMGEPFLEVANQVMGAITKILSMFNSLPDGLKKAIAVTSIFAAIMGPLVMLTGLTANFGGYILKMAVAAMGVATNFKLVNKESKAATLAAELAKKGFISETTALQRLTAEMKAMTAAATEGALAQKQLMLAGNSASQIRNGKVVSNVPIVPNNLPRSRTNGLNLVSAPTGHQTGPLVRPTSTVTQGVQGPIRVPIVDPESPKNAKETSKWLQAGAVSAGVLSAAMAVSMFSTNETANKVANFAMVASIAAPAFSGIASSVKKIEWDKVGKTISTKWTAGASAFKSGLSAAAGEISLMASNLTSRKGIAYELDVAGQRMNKVKDSAKGLGGNLKRGLGSILGMISPIGWIGIGLGAAAGAAYLIYRDTQRGAKEVQKMYGDATALGDILGFAAVNDGMIRTLNKAGESIIGMEAKAAKFREEYGYVTSQIRNATSDQEAFNYAMSQGLKVIHSGGTAEQAREAVEVALRAAKKKAAAERILLKFDARLDFSNAQNLVALETEQIGQKVKDAMEKVTGTATFWEDVLPTGQSTSNIRNEGIEQAKEAGKSAAIAYVEAYDNNLNTAPIASTAQKQLDMFNKFIADNAGTLVAENAINARDQFLEGLIGNRVDDTEDYVNALDEGVTVAEIMADVGMVITGETGKSADNVDKMGGKYGKAKNEADKLTAAQKRLNAMQEAAKEVDWASEYKSMMEDTQSEIADIASENFDDRMQSALDDYRAAQEARMDALQDSQERASEAQDRRHERETNAFESRWERRKDAIEAAYDSRVENIQNAIEAEQKAEDIRQRIFDAEIQRMQRMADMQNQNIDFNVAINSGDLDEAAKIRNDMQAQETDWALGDASDKAALASERRIKRLENREDRIEEARDKRIEAIEAVEEAERKALERRQEREQKFLEKQQERNEKALQKEVDNNIEAQEDIWDNRKNNVDKAIELFKAYVPKNEKDLRRHVARISKRYGDFNVTTKGKFNKTAIDIGDMLTRNVKESSRRIRDEIRWAGVGDKIATDMIRGAFGMSPRQFQKWLITGKWPKGADINDKGRVGSSSQLDNAADSTGRGFGAVYHTGGIVGTDRGGQAGIRKGHNDEVRATLLKGEGVLNRDAMSKIGPSGFRALNSGQISGTDTNQNNFGTGGGGAGMGIAGIMGAMMYRAVRTTLGWAAANGHNARLERNAASAGSYSAGNAGMYSDRFFSAQQLKNAATIASVGRGMGMSSRDIKIGIMTAITESGLINVDYGDRDSLGLFQQRPSMGWGTAEQVTDPEYAARKFFATLKGVEGRKNMDPWLAAQAVQRSFDPTGSNYRQYWDNAQAIFGGLKASDVAAGYIPGAGGWKKPSSPGKGWMNTHDYRNAIGSPLYAVSDGTIVESRAITSGGSPGNGLYSTPYRSYGETIAMRTASGDIFRYAHLSPGGRFVREGQEVRGGALIGRSGNTGNSSGPHTHFDVNGDYNASGWLASKGIALRKGAANINYDGVPAILHKNEAVLTEDLNSQFKQGVANFSDPESLMKSLMIKAIAPAFQRALADDTNPSRNRRRGGSRNIGETDADATVRIGTLNTKKGIAAAKTNADLARLIGRADLLALTEMHQKFGAVGKWLRGKGWGLLGGKGRDQHAAAVAYNKAQYELLRSGTRKLGDKQADFIGGREKRYANYGLFRDRESGRKVWMTSAHTVPTPNMNAGHRSLFMEQWAGLDRLVNELRGTGHPVFVGGDLNNNPNRDWWRTPGGLKTHKGSGVDWIFSDPRMARSLGQSMVRGMHTDHAGAILSNYNIPSLSVGTQNVRWDNTLANLHKGEAVLTEDINRQFQQGVKRFAEGPNAQYNLNMTVNGSQVNADELVDKTMTALRRMELRKPQSRSSR